MLRNGYHETVRDMIEMVEQGGSAGEAQGANK